MISSSYCTDTERIYLIITQSYSLINRFREAISQLYSVSSTSSTSSSFSVLSMTNLLAKPFILSEEIKQFSIDSLNFTESIKHAINSANEPIVDIKSYISTLCRYRSHSLYLKQYAGGCMAYSQEELNKTKDAAAVAYKHILMSKLVYCRYRWIAFTYQNLLDRLTDICINRDNLSNLKLLSLIRSEVVKYNRYSEDLTVNLEEKIDCFVQQYLNSDQHSGRYNMLFNERYVGFSFSDEKVKLMQSYIAQYILQNGCLSLVCCPLDLFPIYTRSDIAKINDYLIELSNQLNLFVSRFALTIEYDPRLIRSPETHEYSIYSNKYIRRFYFETNIIPFVAYCCSSKFICINTDSTSSCASSISESTSTIESSKEISTEISKDVTKDVTKDVEQSFINDNFGEDEPDNPNSLAHLERTYMQLEDIKRILTNCLNNIIDRQSEITDLCNSIKNIQQQSAIAARSMSSCSLVALPVFKNTIQYTVIGSVKKKRIIGSDEKKYLTQKLRNTRVKDRFSEKYEKYDPFKPKTPKPKYVKRYRPSDLHFYIWHRKEEKKMRDAKKARDAEARLSPETIARREAALLRRATLKNNLRSYLISVFVVHSRHVVMKQLREYVHTHYKDKYLSYSKYEQYRFYSHQVEDVLARILIIYNERLRMRYAAQHQKAKIAQIVRTSSTIKNSTRVSSVNRCKTMSIVEYIEVIDPIVKIYARSENRFSDIIYPSDIFYSYIILYLPLLIFCYIDIIRLYRKRFNSIVDNDNFTNDLPPESPSPSRPSLLQIVSDVCTRAKYVYYNDIDPRYVHYDTNLLNFTTPPPLPSLPLA